MKQGFTLIELLVVVAIIGILGGGIGAIIDHSNGKGYSYSDQMTVTMGKTTLYDKKMESNPKSKK